ncbi:hypothetical protein G7Y79_00013g035340 [Physcia stellaris]|nr:hypothetical protein G7Y79_00013g035340 [Physcia stellaris]
MFLPHLLPLLLNAWLRIRSLPVLSLSFDISRIPFNVTMNNRLGHDVFSHSIAHHRSLFDHVTDDGVKKRATSRAMLRCRSPEDEARYSLCSNRFGGASNGMTILCRPPTTVTLGNQTRASRMRSVFEEFCPPAADKAPRNISPIT